MSMISAIGLMSGTSYDGVDVALINTDGETIGRLGPTGYRAYSDAERTVLRRAIAAAANLGDRQQRPEPLAEAETLLTAVHAEAVEVVPGGERDAGTPTSPWSASTARPFCTSRSGG